MTENVIAQGQGLFPGGAAKDARGFWHITYMDRDPVTGESRIWHRSSRDPMGTFGTPELVANGTVFDSGVIATPLGLAVAYTAGRNEARAQGGILGRVGLDVPSLAPEVLAVAEPKGGPFVHEVTIRRLNGVNVATLAQEARPNSDLQSVLVGTVNDDLTGWALLGPALTDSGSGRAGQQMRSTVCTSRQQIVLAYHRRAPGAVGTDGERSIAVLKLILGGWTTVAGFADAGWDCYNPFVAGAGKGRLDVYYSRDSGDQVQTAKRRWTGTAWEEPVVLPKAARPVVLANRWLFGSYADMSTLSIWDLAA